MLNDLFTQEATRLGGTVVLSRAYKPGQSNFKYEIEEISKRKREIEGLFIPDTYLAAVTIAPQLTYYNVVRIKLLGSSGWNSPKLIELAQGQMSSIEGAVFPDAFFPESTNAITQAFAADFEETYGRKPDMYDALGYETVRVLIEMIKTGAKDRLSMRDALAGLKNFPTFSGNLAAKPDRSFHRPLFLLQVKDGKITEISAQGQM
jgi:ABC-type branched-subunit amino acid transport system substrate-binding protein